MSVDDEPSEKSLRIKTWMNDFTLNISEYISDR